jgi:uncharacterized coiled-coil DUF342 family protein
MVKKRTPTELEKAEVKLRTILDKRDELNEQANIIRQERDLLHQQRKEVSGKMREVRAKRDELVKEMSKARSSSSSPTIKRRWRPPIPSTGSPWKSRGFPRSFR